MENTEISIKNIKDCKNLINNNTYSSSINITIENNNYDCIKYLIKNPIIINT